MYLLLLTYATCPYLSFHHVMGMDYFYPLLMVVDGAGRFVDIPYILSFGLSDMLRFFADLYKRRTIPSLPAGRGGIPHHLLAP